MAPELGTAVATEADLTKWVFIGIAVGTAVFLFGKHVVGTIVRAMWLVSALLFGQVAVSNDQALLSVIEAGKSVIPSPNNEQFICELYAKKDNAYNLLCGLDFKSTIN